MNQKTCETKRQSLKNIVQAGGITAAVKWSAPVVISIVLPAHAATTQTGGEDLGLTSGLFSGSGTIPRTTVFPL